MTEHRSIAPPFTTSGAEFVCWIADDGQRYVWRSTCGRFAAGRMGARFWARRDGRVVGAEFPSLKFAMIAAVRAALQEAA